MCAIMTWVSSSGANSEDFITSEDCNFRGLICLLYKSEIVVITSITRHSTDTVPIRFIDTDLTKKKKRQKKAGDKKKQEVKKIISSLNDHSEVEV